MSKKPVKTSALAWSGASRRVESGAANKGAVEGFRLGVAESGPAPSAPSGPTRHRSKSLFTERPAVDVQRMDDDEPTPSRPNGRVKLDRI